MEFRISFFVGRKSNIPIKLSIICKNIDFNRVDKDLPREYSKQIHSRHSTHTKNSSYQISLFITHENSRIKFHAFAQYILLVRLNWEIQFNFYVHFKIVCRVGFDRFVRTPRILSCACWECVLFYGLFALRVYSLYIFIQWIDVNLLAIFECKSTNLFERDGRRMWWQKKKTQKWEKDKTKWKVQSLTTSLKTMEMASTYAHLLQFDCVDGLLPHY